MVVVPTTLESKGFPAMTIYTPYTYLIGWSDMNKYYYGVRYAKGCSPEDFWVKYKTSSKLVKIFAEEYGDPDIIQIRKTFDCADKARIWENVVLRRMKVVERDDFLNQTNNKAIIISEETRKNMFTEEVRQKMSDSAKKRILRDGVNHKALDKARSNIKYSETRNDKISKAMTGREIHWGDKISEAHKKSGRFDGKNNPMYGKSAIKDHNLKWYTDGKDDIFVPEGSQPKGFVCGNSATKRRQTGKSRSQETRDKMSKKASSPENVKRSKMKLYWNNASVCCIACRDNTSNVWFDRKHSLCFCSK